LIKILERIGELGIIPVVKIEKAKDALPLGRALLDGDLPIAEITFRTSAAEESIEILTKELPELLVGAGTEKGNFCRGEIYCIPGFQSKSSRLLYRK